MLLENTEHFEVSLKPIDVASMGFNAFSFHWPLWDCHIQRMEVMRHCSTKSGKKFISVSNREISCEWSGHDVEFFLAQTTYLKQQPLITASLSNRYRRATMLLTASVADKELEVSQIFTSIESEEGRREKAHSKLFTCFWHLQMDALYV